MDPFDTQELLVAATCYFLGRQTIAACDHAAKLASAWDDLPARTQKVLQDHIDRAFRRDDFAREHNLSPYPLGGDCDRRAWSRVRSQYMTDANEPPESE